MRRLTMIAATTFAIVLLTATTAAASNPYALSDETWISLSGEVEDVSPNSFLLDFGEGSITVEMDDGDRDADAYGLYRGDDVVVTGKIDDGFFEKTTIEASSVYVQKLGTYFFSSAADEEDDFFVRSTVPFETSSALVQGVVGSVSDDEFTIDNGMREMTVVVDQMAFDPLDDEGYQKASQDKEQERDALEWIESLIVDVAETE